MAPKSAVMYSPCEDHGSVAETMVRSAGCWPCGTGPINKSAWHMAGYSFAGHTELLAKCFKSRRVTMMFTGGPLRVALASVHEPLFDLRNRFTIGLVFQPIDLLHDALRDWFGIREPKIAVAGIVSRRESIPPSRRRR